MRRLLYCTATHFIQLFTRDLRRMDSLSSLVGICTATDHIFIKTGKVINTLVCVLDNVKVYLVE